MIKFGEDWHIHVCEHDQNAKSCKCHWALRRFFSRLLTQNIPIVNNPLNLNPRITEHAKCALNQLWVAEKKKQWLKGVETASAQNTTLKTASRRFSWERKKIKLCPSHCYSFHTGKMRSCQCGGFFLYTSECRRLTSVVLGCGSPGELSARRLVLGVPAQHPCRTVWLFVKWCVGRTAEQC